MTDEERKVLIETSIAVGAILEGLSDGVGIHDFANLARIFRERVGEDIVKLARSRPTVTAEPRT